MRIFLFVLLLCCSVKSFAQQDYFYAETLIDNGQHAEAVRVLDHLIDSGAYADRPRFAMMTLNLAGTTKRFLRDTTGARTCFEAVRMCYDTLSAPLKSDDWNHREYYTASEYLARMHYSSGDYSSANKLLMQVGYPGAYYSATGSDVLDSQDSYCSFRANIFQKLNQPDSAFAAIRRIRDRENTVVRKLDSLFDVTTNNIQHVKCVAYTIKSTDADIDSPGYLYFVGWSDEQSLQNSIWFVNPESGPIRILGQSTFNRDDDPQNFPANCYNMSLSPDEKYLAVECYTEGSNYIDVFSFPELLNESRCVLKQSILAYPSSVEIKGWENSLMIVESDADLTRLNKKQRINMDVSDNPDLKEQFLFDVESGKYSKK